ncbi:phosphate ABC transporter substrate-binding protein, PhoT family [Jatrophihabitans endophyticus]|uniref:Phosphate-binding protein n=1 Tax=Jatrophihabitans endophyticus TaxID=1206085 RepID=A0A1M5ICN6_9ACTN|nr:phosphate ABC transporter substrate-binding protein PstS [Jatrophihabitans endophyticus]SHG25523.1 phosphate ABC transporter substrate-binding protein, PhoT family [Jatrophihabitans endophyticus]
MKFNRAGVAAGLLATTVALAACGSDASGSGSSDTAGSTTGATTSGSSSTGGGAAAACSTGTLNGEGSTAQTNAVTEWTNAYQKACTGAKINYNPTGSGAGISQFNAGQVDFAGSDSPLSKDAGEVAAAQKRCKSAPLDLPMVVGPIAIGYKLDGVDKLVLTPDLLAKIFTGKITKWNDPAITAKNSGAKLPSSAINVIFRSDASGTTQNFEKYLAATAPSDFTAEPAKDNAAKVFKGQGKAKSQGVAAAVAATEGSIGYAEYSFAVDSSLATAQIDSGSGPVEISKDTASAAAGEAKVAGTGDDLSLQLNYKPSSAKAYPIILVTYEIACTKYSDSAKGTFVKNFLNYTIGAGQDVLASKGYAPIPTELATKVKASIAKIS